MLMFPPLPKANLIDSQIDSLSLEINGISNEFKGLNGAYCGGGEIRTHGRLLTYVGFQDRCIKPLCHPSEGANSYCNRHHSQIKFRISPK